MRRETQNVLLVLLGGALLKLAWTGGYLRYVKPSLLPFLVAAGVVIVGLGLLAVVRDVRAATAGAPPPGDGHDHDHVGRSPWLLLLPVLAIFLVAPPALGAHAVSRSVQASTAPPQQVAEFSPLPAGPAPPMRLGDLVTRAIWDRSGSLDGRTVTLLGFVVRGSAGTPYLARMSISCCAADATPVRVRLAGAGEFDGQLATLPEDAWYEVRGQVVPGSAGPRTRYVPTVAVSALRPVPEPAEPYEF